MPSEFYLTGIKKFFYRCNIRNAVKGDYVENESKNLAYVISESYRVAERFE